MCMHCTEEVQAYLDHFGLPDWHRDLAVNHLCGIAAALSRHGRPESNHAPELPLRVPTYYGSVSEHQTSVMPKAEFDVPNVPVLVRQADGVRIVLGSHDFDDMTVPDIQIERRPRGWAVFVHPVGGSDASGYLYLLDDGRSFLVPENFVGPTPPIRMLSPYEYVAEIDSLK